MMPVMRQHAAISLLILASAVDCGGGLGEAQERDMAQREAERDSGCPESKLVAQDRNEWHFVTVGCGATHLLEVRCPAGGTCTRDVLSATRFARPARLQS